MSQAVALLDVEAEQSVLGALMIDPSRFDLARELVGQADFYDLRHGKIFAAIESLALASRHTDPVTVADVLVRRGELSECGDLAYLGELALNTPSAVNIRRYAGIVADRALRRRVLRAGERLADAAVTAENVDTLLQDSLSEIGALQPEDEMSLCTSADLGQAALAFVSARMDDPDGFGGATTGFADIDARWMGMRPSELIVIAGRPAMGKTVFALNVANHVEATAGTVLMFSMEMGKEMLGLRQQATFGSIPLGDLMRGHLTPSQLDVGLINATRRMAESRLLVDFRPALSVQQVRARARSVQRKHGLSAIVVDYLQLMTARGRDNRTTEVAEISGGLKAIAKELGVPVIALSQLSRKVEERADKRPQMGDLRESGAIEQDADIIAMLYRDEYYHPDSPAAGTVEVITVKHRMGLNGVDHLAFQGEYSRMRDLAADARADIARARSEPRRKVRYSGLD